MSTPTGLHKRLSLFLESNPAFSEACKFQDSGAGEVAAGLAFAAFPEESPSSAGQGGG